MIINNYFAVAVFYSFKQCFVCYSVQLFRSKCTQSQVGVMLKQVCVCVCESVKRVVLDAIGNDLVLVPRR